MFVTKFSRDLGSEYKRFGIVVQCLMPGYVATKMSKIKKPTWMAPSPKKYVRCALQTVGVEDETTGYYPHSLLVSTSLWLVHTIVDYLVGNDSSSYWWLQLNVWLELSSYLRNLRSASNWHRLAIGITTHPNRIYRCYILFCERATDTEGYKHCICEVVVTLWTLLKCHIGVNNKSLPRVSSSHSRIEKQLIILWIINHHSSDMSVLTHYMLVNLDKYIRATGGSVSFHLLFNWHASYCTVWTPGISNQEC